MNKFYRSNEKYVGGVCGGLGKQTGVDPIIWRLIFLFVPSAIWVYLAMWIFTEEEYKKSSQN